MSPNSNHQLKTPSSATPPQRHVQFAATCIRDAHRHHEGLVQVQRALLYQHEALRIGTTALDAHVLAVLDSFEGVSVNAKRELERQGGLLAGLDGRFGAHQPGGFARGVHVPRSPQIHRSRGVKAPDIGGLCVNGEDEASRGRMLQDS
ncbi:hypothetical protein BKA70DRAFT_398700 [Coprinopsis sp. MPI-PUGE-AT-0042]|nr:hypothetical protein BKA70DRAFT_398700 [Coprinopsis sp. MPI-PUGE-AT-0042]